MLVLMASIFAVTAFAGGNAAATQACRPGMHAIAPAGHPAGAMVCCAGGASQAACMRNGCPMGTASGSNQGLWYRGGPKTSLSSWLHAQRTPRLSPAERAALNATILRSGARKPGAPRTPLTLSSPMGRGHQFPALRAGTARGMTDPAMTRAGAVRAGAASPHAGCAGHK